MNPSHSSRSCQIDEGAFANSVRVFPALASEYVQLLPVVNPLRSGRAAAPC